MENSLEGNDAITLVKGQVEQFLNDTADARALQERDRDYYDHKQWTAHEVAKLRKRNQAPIVVNRIKPKVEGLIGLYNMRRVDPKAYARTQKHEQASHAITDALRFVAESNDFNSVKQDVAEDFWVEGYAGAIVEVKQKKSGDFDIRVNQIPWDRIYFDPHSRKRDFSDARFKGFMLWLGEDQVIEILQGMGKSEQEIKEIIDSLCSGYTDETFEDRPSWHDKQRKRYRLAYHFWIKDGIWHYCMFSGDTFIVEPTTSWAIDDEGEPECPIELVSANIDRENNRYGEVRGYIPLQDEINHRRSKALHLLSQRQTKARKGAIKDVAALKRELAKPDGHVEVQGAAADFEILETGDMAQGQFEIYQDAKAELDAVGMNAQLSGERQQGDLSGKAIDRLQQAGTMELNRQFGLLTAWEKRIYRQVWARVKQYWTEEKWIRVTDDHDNLRWVGLNSEISTQKFLEEKINDKSIAPSEKKQYAASYQFLMNAAQAQDPNDPRVEQMAQQAKAKLEEIIEIKNDVSELDVDVILDQSFDTINIEQEQFELLAKMAQVPNSGIDAIELIRVSQIRGREEMIERIEKSREAQIQATGNMAQIETQEAQARVAKTMSEVQINTETAVGKKIENTLMIQSPEKVDNITV